MRRRGQSVHALQALTLLNSDFMRAQSQALALRVLTGAAPNTPGAAARPPPTRTGRGRKRGGWSASSS